MKEAYPINAEKTRILYTGDVMAGSLYLLIGVIAAFASAMLYIFTTRLGFYYLSIGLAILAMYMIGKGVVMIYMYGSRKRYYKNHDKLSKKEIKEERRYTRWRVYKKKRNRRRYIYSMIIAAFIAFMGMFHHEKGLIISTCIPIIVMAAVEFTVGLLTEFRLFEYLKHLHKLSQHLKRK